MDRSEIMRRVKATDTSPEIVVRKQLHKLGYRYSLHDKHLPGRPDIVLPARRAIVFVHGCWWHGHTCKRGARKASNNAAYWNAKIRGNKRRDVVSIAALRRLGWRVAVVWECKISKNIDGEIVRLHLFLQKKELP